MFGRKIVNIFLSNSLNIRFGAQKNLPIETVLLSIHNMCFVREIRKLIVNYALLSQDLAPEIIKLYFMLNSTVHKISTAHKN